MKHARAILIGVIAVALWSSWVAAQSERGNTKNGQMIYEQHCLRCHGVKLDGNGPDAKLLTVPPANLQSLRSRSKTDWELLVVISHGMIFSPMHGWRDRLTEDQMLDVLRYIRTMAPFEAIS